MLNGVAFDGSGNQLDEGRVKLLGATKRNTRSRHCKRSVLLMVKGDARGAHRWTPGRIIDTAFCSNGKKVKRHTHNWDQPLRELIHLLERLSRPGDLVVDFACETRTSGIASAVLGGGRFIGCDRSREEVVYARRWLQAVLEDRAAAERPAIEPA